MHPIPPITSPLLAWYSQHSRSLPWRDNPFPYAVWVSEIMLQQTRVEAVKPYFDRFLQELPTIRHLAQANEQTLLKLWEGLGYYSRVRNLQKAAQVVVQNYGSQLPASFEELKAASRHRRLYGRRHCIHCLSASGASSRWQCAAGHDSLDG